MATTVFELVAVPSDTLGPGFPGVELELSAGATGPGGPTGPPGATGPAGTPGTVLPGVSVSAGTGAAGEPIALYVGGPHSGTSFNTGTIYLWDQSIEAYYPVYFANDGDFFAAGKRVIREVRYLGTVRSPAVDTYPLDSYVEKRLTLTQIRVLKVATGSLVVTFKRNGVAVAGWTALAVTTTSGPVAVTMALAVADSLDLEIVSGTATGFVFSIPGTPT